MREGPVGRGGARPVALPCAVCLALVVGCLDAGSEAGLPEIRINPGPDGHLERVTFDVDGLNAADLAALAKVAWSGPEWSALLHVSADNRSATDRDGAPPLPGRYRVVGRVLRFIPDATPGEGQRYRVVFEATRLPGRVAGPGGTVEALFTPPPPGP